MSALSIMRSILISSFAGWRGTATFRAAYRQPVEPLQLYDIEACPYCRLVREALTELDIDVLILPCPKNGTRYREQAQALAGKQQFPLLVDPNTGTSLYESADIIDYLGKTYDGRTRSTRGLGRIAQLASSMLASSLQSPAHGLRAAPSRAPAQPLELYSFESSPYSRVVREVLCELQLPYLLRNTGKARMSDMGTAMMRDRWWKGPKDTSRNRKALLARAGQVQVPYLVDANTGIGMFESADIIAYLRKTYGA